MNHTGSCVERPATVGFTLLEMIAVVIVVGVLAATLVPMVGNTIEDARKAKAQSDTKAIVNAIAMYKMVNAAYPVGSCAAGCTTCSSGNPAYNYAHSGGGCGVEGQNVHLVSGSRKYLAKAIGNDPWGILYTYHIYTLANPYMDVSVYSNGPDRVNSTWDGGPWNNGTFNGDDIGALFDSE